MSEEIKNRIHHELKDTSKCRTRIPSTITCEDIRSFFARRPFIRPKDYGLIEARAFNQIDDSRIDELRIFIRGYFCCR